MSTTLEVPFNTIIIRDREFKTIDKLLTAYHSLDQKIGFQAMELAQQKAALVEYFCSCFTQPLEKGELVFRAGKIQRRLKDNYDRAGLIKDRKLEEVLKAKYKKDPIVSYHILTC